MTRLPLTICLALAWFLAVDALLSIAVAGASAWLRGRTRGSGAGHVPIPGKVAFGMRLLPSAAAATFVAGVFVPAFVLHEPARGPEAVGWIVRGAAAATVILALCATARGRAARRGTRTLVSGWMASAAPIRLDDERGGVDAHVIETPFPVVALVGVLAPRLFIARQVLEALTPGELQAAVAHELAHRRARDNAKRLLLSCTPGLLPWSAVGRRLESEWALAAEWAADRMAADSRGRGLDLAGALVKVSRLAIAPAPAMSSVQHAPRARRCRRPGNASSRPRSRSPPRPRRGGIWTAILVAGGAVLWLPQVLAGVHGATEWCLRSLP